jgi:hypothetical protein
MEIILPKNEEKMLSIQFSNFWDPKFPQTKFEQILSLANLVKWRESFVRALTKPDGPIYY